MLELTEAEKKFVLHWGEVASRWGFNRTEGQIHGVLYLSEDPVPADELTEILSVSRSNVSQSLKALRNRDLAETVQKLDDRRDFFTTCKDPWEVFRRVFEFRRRGEMEHTFETVKEAYRANVDERGEDAYTTERMEEMLDFLALFGEFIQQIVETDSDGLRTFLRNLGGETE